MTGSSAVMNGRTHKDVQKILPKTPIQVRNKFHIIVQKLQSQYPRKYFNILIQKILLPQLCNALDLHVPRILQHVHHQY